MSARHLFDREPEALVCDASLEREGKQAILARCQDARWNIRPAGQWPRLAKHARARASDELLGCCCDLRGHIM
jgi:hypothetical protein